jgi:hypothetical protein
VHFLVQIGSPGEAQCIREISETEHFEKLFIFMVVIHSVVLWVWPRFLMNSSAGMH